MRYVRRHPFALAFGLAAIAAWVSHAQTLAFPTAEGHGRHSKGGRGGRVIEVTNLEDSGPGSLRAAIDATGPRIVVFRVSGVITLKSKLLITGTKGNSFVTVAGQTAPGKGICIRGWTFGMIGGNDVVVRHIRLKLGNIASSTMDGMGMSSGNNSIFDHCSISWTLDEGFSSRGAKNITFQRSLISEALNEAGHSNYPAGTRHGYAASISGDIGSFHHNLLAHCAGRNWSLAGGLDKAGFYQGRLDIFNNVVYNWDGRTTDGGAHEVNFVNNYYKPGPASNERYAFNGQWDGFPGTQTVYCAGNVVKGYFENASATRNGCRMSEKNPKPWTDKPFFPSHAKVHSAADAYAAVLADVGANRPMQDDHDKRVIAETRTGTAKYEGSRTGLPGLPDSQEDVGGWEDYPKVNRPADFDTDKDGMPDAWEASHGLDAKSAADGTGTQLSQDGYTNVEMYLNELAGDMTVGTTALGPPPSHPHTRSGRQATVVLSIGPEGRFDLSGRMLP